MSEPIAKSIKRWLLVLFVLWFLGIVSNVYLKRSIDSLDSNQQQIGKNQQKIEVLQIELNETQKQFNAMATARKNNLVATIRILKSLNLYTEAEKRAIADNWENMQYGDAPNPFAEFKTK